MIGPTRSEEAEPVQDHSSVREVMMLARRALNEELPMGALYAIVALRGRLREAELAAVEGARARGANWEDIAAALGVSRQALHQRIQRTRVGTG
jgi:DNA-directed RNA polymerase specialized sigma24 family protein